MDSMTADDADDKDSKLDRPPGVPLYAAPMNIPIYDEHGDVVGYRSRPSGVVDIIRPNAGLVEAGGGPSD
jgi:hypothetical protein